MTDAGSGAIVITGLGLVNSAGCGRQATLEALAAGTPSWTEVDRSAGYHRPGSARLAGRIDAAGLTTWVTPREGRRMSVPSRFAVAAARMALDEAGIAPGDELVGRPTAMVFSNAFGPSSTTEKILTQVQDSGPMAVSPALFTESVSNAPAAQVALACRARGANITITQREAGGLIALARAADELRRGRAGYTVVATVDEATPLLHAVLDRFRALARADEHGPEASRPYDRRRNGFVMGEGATALVLERRETADRRGARVLARLTGHAAAFDPDAPTTGWNRNPESLANALERFLIRGRDDRPIEAIIAGGSGSHAGDALDARVLRTAWGAADLPPLLAPQAVLGTFGGAQLAAAVLALEGASFGAIAGFAQIDPTLAVAPHAGGALRAGGCPAPATVLVQSLATGGAAAWTRLETGEATGGAA